MNRTFVWVIAVQEPEDGFMVIAALNVGFEFF